LRQKSESSHLIDCYKEDHDSDEKSLAEILGLDKKDRNKRELIKCWEKLNDFEEFERVDSQSISQYVLEFEKKYQSVVTSGVTLSPEVLAMKLLGKGNLAENERSYIIRTLDFTQRDEIYEEVKRKLKKLCNYQNTKSDLEKITSESKANEKNAKGEFFLILDSACSSTLCGKKWLESYLEYLGKESLDDVEYNPGKKSFIFGGGTPVKSLLSCRIPAYLAGKFISIEVDVVPNDLPLVFSLNDMKKAGIKLDFTSDSAEIHGKKVNLAITDTGHYSVPIDGAPWKRRPLRQLSQ